MHRLKLRTTASHLGQGSTSLTSKHQPETVQGWFCGGWHTSTLGWFFHLDHTSQERAACEAAHSIFYTDQHLLKAGTDDRDNTCSPILSESLLHEVLMCPCCPSPVFRNDSAMPGPLLCISHCLCLIHRQHTQRWTSTRAMGLPIAITETTHNAGSVTWNP